MRQFLMKLIVTNVPVWKTLYCDCPNNFCCFLFLLTFNVSGYLDSHASFLGLQNILQYCGHYENIIHPFSDKWVQGKWTRIWMFFLILDANMKIYCCRYYLQFPRYKARWAGSQTDGYCKIYECICTEPFSRCWIQFVLLSENIQTVHEHAGTIRLSAPLPVSYCLLYNCVYLQMTHCNTVFLFW
jgi:hypothetical protein